MNTIPEVKTLIDAMNEVSAKFPGTKVVVEKICDCIAVRLMSDEAGKYGIGAYMGNVMWDTVAKTYRLYAVNGTKYKTVKGVMKKLLERTEAGVAKFMKEKQSLNNKKQVSQAVRAIIEKSGIPIVHVQGREDGDVFYLDSNNFGISLIISPCSSGSARVEFRYSQDFSMERLEEFLKIV